MRAAFEREPLSLLPALLLGVVCILYWPTTHTPFQFDDYNVIVNNVSVHSLQAWRDSMPGIRPLLKLSYTLNWIFDKSASGFHLFNLFCHLLNTILVFALLQKLTTSFLIDTHSSNPKKSKLIALTGAALFALHPAQTEAITYICGRSVSLMSVFYLLSLWTGVSQKESERKSARLFSPALFLCALLVKETAWTAPFALLLIECARGRPFKKSLQTLWSHWAMLGFGALLLFAVDDYRNLLQHSLAIRSVSENLQLQVAGQFYLLTNPLLLLRTNIDPEITLSSSLWLAQAAALLTLLLVGAWQWQQGRRWIGFGIVWFFLHLLPTNSLLPRNDIANDRQLYLALIGPALMLSFALFSFRSARLSVATLALLTLLLMAMTYFRNHDYRSEIALWHATALQSPHKARAWNNLGYAYQQAGAVDAARAAYLHAVQLDPNAMRARINLQLLPQSAGAASGDSTSTGK